jgi:hypothetical protein
MTAKRYLSLTPSLASVFLLVTLSSCGGTKIPPEYEWFYELDDDQRATAVVELEPDTQVDLCLLSRYVEHPASPTVCWAVAGEGARVVPAISKRLAIEEHPDLQLFNLLHRMNQEGHYNVAEDQELMSLLEAKSAAMVMEYWRDVTGEQIGEIRRSVQTPE